MAESNSTRHGRRFIDLTSKTFGRWTVIEFYSLANARQAVWLCRCKCGIVKPVHGNSLRRGLSQSCQSCANVRHGRSYSPEYYVWQDILARCKNSNNPAYHNYGGRGIIVCDRWMTFKNFLIDVGMRPSSKHSIDRIDNDGNYEKTNCRWATQKTQNRNRRTNKLLTHHGKTVCVAEWADATGIAPSILYNRLRRGWSVERTLTAPVQQRNR
jgi:hypothetical protein